MKSEIRMQKPGSRSRPFEPEYRDEEGLLNPTKAHHFLLQTLEPFFN